MRLRRALAFVATMVAVMAVPIAAHAATNFQPGPLSVNPPTGPAGSSFTASQPVPFEFARGNCVDWFVRFDGTIESGHDGNSKGPTRSAAVQVPTTAGPGFHSVLSYCVTLDGETNVVGQGTFEVPAPATTTTASTTTTTTIPSTTTTASTTTTVKATTTTAKATTTTAKATTTTAKATTTTAAGTTTTAASTTTTSTTTTIASTTTTAPVTRATEVRELALDKPSVAPGGDVVATGQGCDAAADVTLEIEGQEVGSTTAAEDGTFSTPIDVPDVDPGRLEVTARCGPILTTELDVVLTSSVTGGQSILLVIAISVILLCGLVWYGLQSGRS